MPLPPKRFEAVSYVLGQVGPDLHVNAGKAWYSVPWQL